MSGLAAPGAKLAIFTAENIELAGYLLIVLMLKHHRRQNLNPARNCSVVTSPRSARELLAA
jgi:hypothetical protein